MFSSGVHRLLLSLALRVYMLECLMLRRKILEGISSCSVFCSNGECADTSSCMQAEGYDKGLEQRISNLEAEVSRLQK